MNEIFKTEGIRYCGSKRSLLPKIHELIAPLQIESALDAFAGSTRVSQYFKKMSYRVHANDVAAYSKVFAETYLLGDPSRLPRIREAVAHLNAIPSEEGYFTKFYAGDENASGNMVSRDGKKKPFLRKNTMRLDAIRREIDVIAADQVEHSILLTALILALDGVENSLGHQAAWLSRWSERSRKEIQLVAPTLIAGRNDHTISVGDAGAVMGAFDLAYLDPPYNTNNPHTKTTRIRYSGYYHLWTTIVKNDRPEIFGATCRRADSSDRVPGALSEFEKIDYESNRRALATLLSSIDARYYLLSYSNKGKLKKDDIVEILSTRGKVSVTEIPHKENVQKSLTSTQQYLGDASANLEYLFLVESR